MPASRHCSSQFYQFLKARKVHPLLSEPIFYALPLSEIDDDCMKDETFVALLSVFQPTEAMADLTFFCWTDVQSPHPFVHTRKSHPPGCNFRLPITSLPQLGRFDCMAIGAFRDLLSNHMVNVPVSIAAIGIFWSAFETWYHSWMKVRPSRGLAGPRGPHGRRAPTRASVRVGVAPLGRVSPLV
jgi:hypothetical protein